VGGRLGWTIANACYYETSTSLDWKAIDQFNYTEEDNHAAIKELF